MVDSRYQARPVSIYSLPLFYRDGVLGEFLCMGNNGSQICRQRESVEDIAWAIITIAEMKVHQRDPVKLASHLQMQLRMISSAAYDLLDIEEMRRSPEAAERRSADVDAICAKLNI